MEISWGYELTHCNDISNHDKISNMDGSTLAVMVRENGLNPLKKEKEPKRRKGRGIDLGREESRGVLLK